VKSVEYATDEDLWADLAGCRTVCMYVCVCVQAGDPGSAALCIVAWRGAGDHSASQ